MPRFIIPTPGKLSELSVKSFKGAVFSRGYSLIEILVVVSILAILAYIGFSSLNNAQKNARDLQRKHNVDLIAKTYEGNYNFSTSLYPVLTPELLTEEFSSNKLPDNPDGATFSGILTSAKPAFQLCVALEDNPSSYCDAPSSNCFCKESKFGSYTASGGVTPPLGGGSSCANPDSQLAAYWKMNDSPATTVNDSSGNNADLPFAVDNDNPPAWTTGKFNGALLFEGLETGTPPSAALEAARAPDGTAANVTGSAVSYGGWVWLNSYTHLVDFATHYGVIFNKGGNYVVGGPPDPGYRLMLSGDTTDWINNNAFVIQINGAEVATSIDSAKLNTWQHIFATYDGNTIKVYLDGLPASGAEVLAPGLILPTSSRARIGNTGYDYVTIKGKIDDFRVYNCSLSPQQVQDLYNSIPSP